MMQLDDKRIRSVRLRARLAGSKAYQAALATTGENYDLTDIELEDMAAAGLAVSKVVEAVTCRRLWRETK